jgi:hypothetical protein
MATQFTDTPDWGGTYTNKQMYPLFDMGELAARLWSPVTYDRRGSVLWMYDFSEGLKGIGISQIGTGSAVGLSVNYWERPPCSAIIQSGTGDGDSAGVYFRLPVPQGLRCGVQASMRGNTNVSELYTNLYHYDGTTKWYAYLRADLDNHVLYASTAEEGDVVLDDAFPDIAEGYYFAHFKIVADLATHTLIRGIADGNEYDLSAYTMPSEASVLAPHILIYINNVGHNLSLAPANVDTMVVTTNEP